MSGICRLSAPLAVGIFAASEARAEPTTVGAVDKVQARVDATQAGQTRPLVVNSDVYFRDRCHSREGARLQATLKDGTQLMLGENATFVVDEFIYDPARSRGELSVGVVKGAFLYVVGGLIERGTGPKVQIRAPLGLRLRHCSSPTRFTFIEDKHTDNEALGSPFKCRFGHTQFIAGNDGRARIAFSNGSGRMLFVGFDALGCLCSLRARLALDPV